MEYGLDARHFALYAKDPIYRKYEHHHLTFGMLYQYSESFVQVFSHDEVVHGKVLCYPRCQAILSLQKQINLEHYTV